MDTYEIGCDSDSEDLSLPTLPESNFKAGDFAMIMTSNSTSALNGLGVTIQRAIFVPHKNAYRYTCTSEDFGDNGSTLTVAAVDLRKPLRKPGEWVVFELKVRRKHKTIEGTVSKVVRREGGKFEYEVDLGKVTVEEKNMAL